MYAHLVTESIYVYVTLLFYGKDLWHAKFEKRRAQYMGSGRVRAGVRAGRVCVQAGKDIFYCRAFVLLI